MKGQNQRSLYPSPCSGMIRTFTSMIRKLLPIPGGRETMWWEWAGWEPSQGSQIRLLAKDTNNVISDQGLYSIRSTPSSDCYLGLLLYFDWLCENLLQNKGRKKCCTNSTGIFHNASGCFLIKTSSQSASKTFFSVILHDRPSTLTKCFTQVV